MFVGSYTPFVAGFAKLFSIPKKWTDESNMAQTWIHHNYALFFSSNPMVRWELELRSKGSYSYSELQMGEPKKELRIVRYSQAPDGFSQTRMFDKCGSTQLLGGLGFTWSFFPTPKAPCPPRLFGGAEIGGAVRMDSKRAKSGDFGWGFRGDTAGYGKWPIFSLYIYKIAMASIAMWNYQSIFKVHDSHMNLWDEIQTETSTLTKTSASPPELGAISGVSLKFSPYHLVI